MGADDKIENKAEELKGKVKEGAGKVTDDHSLEAEGHADQAKAGLKQAGEHVKDSFTKNEDNGESQKRKASFAQEGATPALSRSASGSLGWTMGNRSAEP